MSPRRRAGSRVSLAVIVLTLLCAQESLASHFRGIDAWASVNGDGVVSLTVRSRWRKGDTAGVDSTRFNSTQFLCPDGSTTPVFSPANGLRVQAVDGTVLYTWGTSSFDLTATTVSTDTTNPQYDERVQSLIIPLGATAATNQIVAPLGLSLGTYDITFTDWSRAQGIQNIDPLEPCGKQISGFGFLVRVVWDGHPSTGPVFSSPNANMIAARGFAATKNSGVTDPDGDSVAYALLLGAAHPIWGPVSQTPGLIVDGTGQLRIGAADTTGLLDNAFGVVGPDYVYKLQATDARGFISMRDAYVDAVTSTNHSPSINAPTSVVLHVADTLSVSVDAEDLDQEQTLSLSGSPLPTGATFPAASGASPVNSVLHWVPTVDQTGDYTITFTATDSGTQATNFQDRLTTTSDLHITVLPACPTFAVIPPPDLTIPTPPDAVGCVAHLTRGDIGMATTVDGCGAVTITVDGVPPANVFPVGDTLLMWKAVDSVGNVRHATQKITVIDKTGPKITLHGNASETVECHTSYGDPGATATDNCDPSVAVTVSGTVAVSMPGTYVLTYNAMDSAGNPAAPVTRTVAVVDTTPPQIVSCAGPRVATHVVHCQDSVPDFTHDIVATDSCSNNNLTVTQSPLPGTMVGLGVTNVVITVTDPAGNAAKCTTTFTVNNAPPLVSAGGPYTVVEGSDVVVTASGSDPEGDAIAYTWDFGSGFVVNGISATYHAIEGGATNTIHVRGVDECGKYSIADATVNVINAPPKVGTISGVAGPVPTGSVVTLSAPFTDPGVLDTHSASWDWDDGSSSAGTVAETNGSGTASGAHVFTSAGVYRVVLKVTDDDGASDSAAFEYVVVFDATAGFVTGGGWINSPPGAYSADPNAAGKANFGFVSKYQKGKSVPTGDTTFQLQFATFNFQSTAYEWLVIAGAKAQYRGQGTINGAGSYRFLLTAVDGDALGGGGVDKFRIKIWNNGTGGVVYDNVRGASDDIDSASPQAIGGGSIVVHK